MGITGIYSWMRANLRCDSLLLEIGAHHCEDTIRFMRMLERANVIVWEPDPRNIPVIRALRLERTKRFILVEAAVGDHDGTTTFFLSGGIPVGATGRDRVRPWSYSSSIRRPKEHLTIHPGVSFIGQAEVPIMRLDTYFDQRTESDDFCRPNIDFIWADVQGAEVDMIRGGTRTLHRTRYLFTEFDERELYEGQINLRAIRELLPEFEEVGQFENNVLLRNTTL